MLTREEVHRTVEQVLSAQFGAGFEHADVRFADDQGGERALFIKAYFRSEARVPNGPLSNRAATQLRLTLLDQGEERFPYLDIDYPPDTSE